MNAPAPRCLDPTCDACSPPAPPLRALPSPRPCANPVCPLPAAPQETRCGACRTYRWRSGVERPARLAQALPAYCTVCGPPRRVKARGLCEACYGYQRRAGRARPARLIQRVPRYCTVCGPPRRVQARGFCPRHYQRWHRARARAEQGHG